MYSQVAADLSIAVTDYTSHDAVEAAKKHMAAREAAASKVRYIYLINKNKYRNDLL